MTPALKKMNKLWPSVSQLVTVPHTRADYERLVHLLDSLIDEVGEKEKHPLATLMETLGVLIESYEAAHMSEPDGDPIDTLLALMTEHGLKQNQLIEIGSQGVVSEILNRKRPLNTRQIKALSKRFFVSPAVFI